MEVAGCSALPLCDLWQVKPMQPTALEHKSMQSLRPDELLQRYHHTTMHHAAKRRCSVQPASAWQCASANPVRVLERRLKNTPWLRKPGNEASVHDI
eukprot:5945289-Amphidinium_carterae.1